MFVLEGAKIVAKYGLEEAPFMTVQGSGYHVSPVPQVKRQSPPAGKQVQSCPVAVECSCVDRADNPTSESPSSEKLFADMFYKHFVVTKERDIYNSCDDNPTLNDLLFACQAFSADVKNSAQARSVARLARSYRGEEQITREQCQSIQDFITCDSTVIQMAVLTALSQLVSRSDNVHLLISHCPYVLDCVLLLASNSSVHEVQISALTVLEKAVCCIEVIKLWRWRVEDTVFPIIQTIITKNTSSDMLKQCSLRVMRNLSQYHALSGRVAQDLLSQLSCFPNSDESKELCLEILLDCFKTSRDDISMDVLERNLLPMLTSVLASGPCKSQWQSLQLLICVSQDDGGKASTLASRQTVALCILCLKLSTCRRVKLCSCQFLQGILNSIAVLEAKKFMKCNSEAICLEGRELGSLHVRKTESRVSSPNQNKLKLWNHFDAFIDQLASQLEEEGCIYLEGNSNDFRCSLNLAGSTGTDQLSTLVSMIESCINLCMWPLQRPGKSHGHLENVEDNMGINSLKLQLSSLNHHHVLVIWSKVGAQILTLFKQVTKQLLALTAVQLNQQHLSLNITQATNHDLSLNLVQQMKNPASEINQTTGQGVESVQQQDNPAKFLPVSQGICLSATTSKEEEYPLAVTKIACSHATKEHNSNSNNHPTKDKNSNSNVQSKSFESLCQIEVKLLKALVRFVFILSVVACHSKKATMSNRHNSQPGNHDTKTKVKAEFHKNNMAAERNLLRHFLVREDIFPLLTQLADLEDDDVKAMCFTVLRLCLRPLEDGPEVTSSRSKPMKTTSAQHRRRSVNKTQVNTDKARLSQKYLSSNLDLGLHYLTKLDSEFSDEDRIIHWTGRVRPISSKESDVIVSTPFSVNMFTPLVPCYEKKHIIPRYSEVLSLHTQFQSLSPRLTGQDRAPLNFKHPVDLQVSTGSGNVTFASGSVSETAKLLSEGCKDTSTQATCNVPQESGQARSQQHSKAALLESGQTALNDIFSPNLGVRTSSLYFLHDLVQHTQKEFHMELSKLGCMPKLLDFLRINDENDLSLITGMTITRMLISSDHRLCQLFHIHGGSSLLMALSYKQPSQEVRQEIASTFSAINKVKRAALEQDSSSGHSERAADIWGKIMQRWEGEDNVVKILTQFL